MPLILTSCVFKAGMRDNFFEGGGAYTALGKAKCEHFNFLDGRKKSSACKYREPSNFLNQACLHCIHENVPDNKEVYDFLNEIEKQTTNKLSGNRH